MNKKNIKRLKNISIVFIILIIVELIYILYMTLFNNTKNIYFDSINSFDYNSSIYVTVGSNNDNKDSYEKAKVTKYNESRKKVFEKLYSGAYNSAFFDVSLDKDSIICVGSYEKSKNDHNNSIRKGLIVKYDLSGNIIFDKEYSLLDNSKFTSITVLNDGYLVTGQSIYKSTDIGKKNGGAILIKYDKNGNLLWSKTYGDNKNSIYNDLIVYNNNIYVVGSNELVKYDLSGNLIKEVHYDGLLTSIMGIDDSLYVSGSKETNGLIIKYDLDLNYITEKTHIDEGNIRYNRLSYDGENIIVIGTIASKSNNSEYIDRFMYDGLIGKYNKSLNKISVVTYGDERDDYFTDIKYINNNYLVVGYSSYEDGSYLSKFIRYSKALKVLGVE